MNGQGGSYIMQPNGEALQVEGQNMTEEQREAAAQKAAAIVADAEAKAKAEAETTATATAGTVINQGTPVRTGRRQQSEE